MRTQRVHSQRSVDSSQEVRGSQTPRIWTPRNPALETLGPAAAAIAELAGTELEEHQRIALDVLLEILEDGRWAHPTGVVIEARQNGKTVIGRTRVLLGLYVIPTDRNLFHTAQDRAVPRELFEELVEAIRETPILRREIPRGGIRETNGQERIRLRDGSTYRILAPRPNAWRSWSADLILFDEAREHKTEELTGAALPTQSARPNPQTWYLSNAGDADSIVLNKLRNRGRAAVEIPGSDPGLAYLEWSAHPDLKADDPRGWAQANPGLGSRITLEAIREELTALSPERFETERLCRWIPTRGPRAIPDRRWRAVAGDPGPIEIGLPRPVMGIHINGDRTYAAIAMAAERDGRLVVDLVSEHEATEEEETIDLLAVADDALELVKRYKVREVAYDRVASSVVARRLEAKGYTVHRIDATEYVVASQNLWDAILTEWLIHRSNPSLDEQIAAAGKRTRADGTWYLAQAESAGVISGVIALAFAVDLAYRPAPSAGIM